MTRIDDNLFFLRERVTVAFEPCNLYLRTMENVGKLVREQTHARSESLQRIYEVVKKFLRILQYVIASFLRRIAFTLDP